MDINFPTPAEEIDLSTLRSAINKHYRDAFKEMRHALETYAVDVAAQKIIKIVCDTNRKVDDLAEAHEKKHHPDTKKEPF